ncbi:MAG: GNAT family N-acetyltransferase [Alphaproteobacteria bacterium]|nr:GNAT family N-acetyltransferase [Alphaproteobacteria bacterium]
MNEVSLPKTGDTAIPELLEPQHLSEVLALQDATRAALPDDQKMFVLPQPSAYFEKLLARENGLMLGMRVDGKLVAQIALMGPLTLEEAMDKNIITRNDVAFHHAGPSESVIVMKSMSVHPEWGGNGLSQHLLQAALGLPSVRVADHVFAQISAENNRSWALFLRNGFGIVAAAVDPQDKKPRFVLQRPALGFALHNLPSVEDSNPLADFSSIMRMTQREALVGRLDDVAGMKLAFHAPSEAAASWYDKSAQTGP